MSFCVLMLAVEELGVKRGINFLHLNCSGVFNVQNDSHCT